jgi:hypothetical protein
MLQTALTPVFGSRENLAARRPARQNGQNVQQAMTTANAEVARWRENQARYAAPSPAPATPREPHMPRVRVL